MSDVGLTRTVPSSAWHTGTASVAIRRPRDLQRTFQLVLATIWLTDAVLQIQPFMFTRGSDGFSGLLHGVATGNPSFVARTITWVASIVYHQPLLTNTAFALVQFSIGFGIAFKRTLRPALALSIVWALLVWWFGEGAGGIFRGSATPFGGGPGAVLFYAVLAVVFWPNESKDPPFVAARALGIRAASVLWTTVWGLLAILSLVGSGRQPRALRNLVAAMDSGQPGWLTHIDRVSESFLLHHGTPAAVLLATLCVLTAVSVHVSSGLRQVMIVIMVVVFAAIWIAIEDFGGILAGGATDPNSGPLVILFALSYWPLSDKTVSRAFDVVPSSMRSQVS